MKIENSSLLLSDMILCKHKYCLTKTHTDLNDMMFNHQFHDQKYKPRVTLLYDLLSAYPNILCSPDILSRRKNKSISKSSFSLNPISSRFVFDMWTRDK